MTGRDLIIALSIGSGCILIPIFSTGCGPNGFQRVKDIQTATIHFKCITRDAPKDFVVLINSTEELETILDTAEACFPYKSEFDFTSSSLIGHFVGGGGCDVTFKQELWRNSDSDEYKFIIVMNQKGKCFMLVQSWNWVVTGKIASNAHILVHIKIRQGCYLKLK